MADSYKVVAINGSPHERIGNTSQMIAMLRGALEKEGLQLEEILLSSHRINYCVGCGNCLTKGGCWIKDDYSAIAKKAFAADAVVLACPVYVFNVTAQMKTFLDRSLGYGHRPQESWKPGMVVSVSAGLGESWVAEYLSNTLRIFGAFPVGQLTAIAVSPGQFLGKEAVEARAEDLARDLARAVKQGRRYPVTDNDLRFWQFIGNLISQNRDLMKADHKHWEEKGLYDSFEGYVGQNWSESSRTPEMRAAWVKSLIKSQQAAMQGRGEEKPRTEEKREPGRSRTARELLEGMPQVLNTEAAKGMAVTYQFEISGSEKFSANLRIENQRASFHEGSVESPDVTIRTPAEVWVAISRGELDGAQAFMSGKYTAEGDLTLLMKLPKLFSR
jgi:multimeric flavodoxin WrbA/putative sterol carrier protein